MIFTYDSEKIAEILRCVEISPPGKEMAIALAYKDRVSYVHNIVAKEEAIEWECFRSAEVNIGGTEFKPPKADTLDGNFEQAIVEIGQVENNLLKALLVFLTGAINQFFFDGNKRTARLMMNGVLLSSGYKILNIRAGDRLEFNEQMVEFYDSQSATQVLEYLINYYVGRS